MKFKRMLVLGLVLVMYTNCTTERRLNLVATEELLKNAPIEEIASDDFYRREHEEYQRGY